MAGFEQYHEPANELSQQIRTFARMVASMIEEADAIDWYQQRMSVEQDESAKKIMADAQEEEMMHFSMDLEWLLRHNDKWKTAVQYIVNQSGDILENKAKASDALSKAHPGLPS